MTPAAQHQAAIEILDRILHGMPPEKALTGWARNARFAGSKDRAAIRDLVFDSLRCLRSHSHLGGNHSGRGVILGALREKGVDPDSLFTGTGHAPAPITPDERDHQPGPMPEGVALDCPDWLLGSMRESLGAPTETILKMMRHRAPVFLRVNIARTDLAKARAALAADGIEATPHPLAPTALEVTQNARALHRAKAYLEGLVELQDAASQAVIAALPPVKGLRVLDYCAGGGGKSLALAALGAEVIAHDANPARMKDIAPRAARAHAAIETTLAPRGAFDLVLTDVPCSGSGSWRRSPAGKWALGPEELSALTRVQSSILDAALPLLRPGGWLAYVTCSLLAAENRAQIDALLQRNPKLDVTMQQQFTPLDGGDGLFLALLRKHN